MDGVDFETKTQATFTRQKVSGHAFFHYFIVISHSCHKIPPVYTNCFFNFASLRARESVCSLNAI